MCVCPCKYYSVVGIMKWDILLASPYIFEPPQQNGRFFRSQNIMDNLSVSMLLHFMEGVEQDLSRVRTNAGNLPTDAIPFCRGDGGM